MPRVLLLLLFALLGVGGPSFAQSQFKEAIKGAVQGSTLEEVIAWSNAQFAKRAAVGRYVRWGGAVVLGAALVYTALDWFYGQLKRETGTSLDNWYYWEPVDNWVYYLKQLYCDDYFGQQVWLYSFSGAGREWELLLGGCSPPDVALAQAEVLARLGSIEGHVWVGPKLAGQYYTWYYVPSSSSRPDLSDWLSSHLDAADALREVVNNYIDVHPIGAPSNPYPGVQLQPVPNPNQWTDNPFTRPDIDTDGDGWPDSIEWNEANRRGVPWPDIINNPEVYPDPNADPDEDGFPNWKELQAGTDPYDANSYPGSATPPPEQKPDEPVWPGGPSPVRPEPVNLPEVQIPQKRDLPRLQEWDQVAESWKHNVQDRLGQRLKQLRDTLRERFPFGIIVLARDRSFQSGSSPCQFPFQIGEAHGSVDICNNPVFSLMASFRPVILGLWTLGLLFLLVRRGLDVQR